MEMNDRNMNLKDISGEVSEGHEEYVVGNWRKDDCYKMVENLAEL